MYASPTADVTPVHRPFANQPASWVAQQQRRAALRRKRLQERICARGNGGGNGDGGGGSGGSGGGGSGGSGSSGPGWRVPLLWVAAWAATAEVYSELQYRGMAVRDARRRAELFPSDSSEPPPLRGPQQAAAAAVAPGVPPLPANPAVSIIVPALNEEAGLEATLRYLQRELSPPAAEIIVVDGGSTDRTAQVARRCGVRVLAAGRGRARQMNAGAAAAKGDVLIFVHADTRPPPSLLPEALAVLRRPQVVLGGFRPVIEHEGKPLRFFSTNNTLKTYYGPLLLRPVSFLRGLRCLFGDQTLFCRAADFRRVGGYDSRLPIMEDADLCIRLHMAGTAARPGRRGQVVQVTAVPNRTSGRRLASWGRLHATAVHVIIGLSWYLGARPEQLVSIYQRLYTDVYR
ncbi:hypothetical protein ABPG77_005285 [Micractinium sp. CCAP 211/92]